MPLFLNLNPGDCLFVQWFREVPLWLALSWNILNFRFNKIVGKWYFSNAAGKIYAWGEELISFLNSKIYLDTLAQSCFLSYLLRIQEKSECFLSYFLRIWEKFVIIPNPWGIGEKYSKSRSLLVNLGELATMDYSKEPYSFLVNNIILSSDNPLQFRKN